MATHSVHVRQPDRGRSIGDYWPLIALILVAALAAGALVAGGFGYARGANVFPSFHRSFMHAYMGVFLVIFALLKIFDLRGFASGFRLYDLISRGLGRWWGYVYPFLELALGLAYLAYAAPVVTYVATILLFGIGALGVLLGLRRGLDIACPCMGNILKVPLSTVTLTEDALMVGMAALLLVA